MSVAGLGTDLVEIERAARLLARKGDHALERLLTPAERAYVSGRPDPASHLAARLAAKEAVYKALQSLPGARGIGWRDIEVLRDAAGRPAVALHGLAERLVRQRGDGRIHLSMTHSATAAAAVAILEFP